MEVFYTPRPECIKSASCLITPSFLPPDHPELQAAHSEHLPVFNRTQALALLARCFVQKLTICTGSLKRTPTALAVAQSLGDDAGWCVGAVIRDSSRPHAKFGRRMVIDLDERDFYHDPALYQAFPNAQIIISGWFNPDFGYYPKDFTEELFVKNLKTSNCDIVQLNSVLNSDLLKSPQLVGWFEPVPQKPNHRHDIRMHPASVYASLQEMSIIAVEQPVHLAIRPFISTLHAYSVELWAQALSLASEVVLIVPPYEGCSTAECHTFAQQLSALGLYAHCLSLSDARNHASPEEYWLWNGAPDLVECCV